MQRRDLPPEFVRVVEMTAIASAQTMRDRKHSDHVAVEAMRRELESVDIDGTLLRGVRFVGNGLRTHSLIMTKNRSGSASLLPSMLVRAPPRGLDFEDFIGL